MKMNVKGFVRRVKRLPTHDDLDRVNCDVAGKVGHLGCGWCPKHDGPAFQCGCPGHVLASIERAEETVHCMAGFGTEITPETISTLVCSEAAVQIDNATYPPILIIEAAMHWLMYSKEKGWPLLDLSGVAIDRDGQLETWIENITNGK